MMTMWMVSKKKKKKKRGATVSQLDKRIYNVVMSTRKTKMVNCLFGQV